MMPKEDAVMVSCGAGRVGRVDGKLVDDDDAYVIRTHRGERGIFLKRQHAAKCTGLAVIVYTLDAFKADPQVTPERLAALEDGTTHVLVAVLGFSDSPKPEVSSHRFTRNAAGGNNEYLAMTADELRAKAKAVVEYEKNWQTVAD